MTFEQFLVNCNKSELVSLIRRFETYHKERKGKGKGLTLSEFYHAENRPETTQNETVEEA